MSTNKSLMDPELADGPLLSVRSVPARAFEPLVERLKTAVRGDGTIIVERDLERDRLLADYRRQFTGQVVHDLSYNLQGLWHWAKGIDSTRTRARAVLRDDQIQDGFGRLNKLRRYSIDNDAWISNNAERDCGTAILQFYFDALQLGDRLYRFQTGLRLRQRSRKSLRRLEIPGVASYRAAQALTNAVDVAIPGLAYMRPLRGLLPAVSYLGMRMVLPWPPYRMQKYLDKLHALLTSGALGSLNREPDELVRQRGVDEFFSNPHFFDRQTGKTRHNIILAFCHRQSVFDITIMAEVMRGIDHGVWSPQQYFPKSIAADPRTVLVGMEGKSALRSLRDKSADILLEQRIPLAIYVNGSIPYLPYGQQMRIKRGIRLLVDHLARLGAGGSRRTYIVPISFDDTVAFIRGLDPHITVTVHQPICTEDIHWEPAEGDRGAINRGDPLLNHLECLFLANTGQIRHGWRTPSVIRTVRRAREESSGSQAWRSRLRGWFHPTLFDLSRAT